MNITGSAPLNPQRKATNFRSMIRFPFSEATGLSYGNLYHWSNVLPRPKDTQSWPQPYFVAAHDFLIPVDKNAQALAAIYHSQIYAWSLAQSSGNQAVLLGCLYRNVPHGGGAPGATGSDTDIHTLSYALRVPSGLGRLKPLSLFRRHVCLIPRCRPTFRARSLAGVDQCHDAFEKKPSRWRRLKVAPSHHHGG